MSRAYIPRIKAGWYRVPALDNGSGVPLFLRIVSKWKESDGDWYVQYLSPLTESHAQWCWEHDQVHVVTRFRRVPAAKVPLEYRCSIIPCVREWSKEGIRLARQRRGLL